jgi:hypothetical protein
MYITPMEWSWDCQEKTKELGMKPWSAVSCDSGDRTLIRCRLLSRAALLSLQNLMTAK